MGHDMNPPLNLFDPDALPGSLPMEPAVAEDVQGAVLARVHALALRITARRELAEDVCVEAYWQAWLEAVRYDAARGQPHEHALDEESLVLEGDATINGVLCRAGDYHFAPRGKPHGWLTSEAGCLLFVRGAADPRAHR